MKFQESLVIAAAIIAAAADGNPGREWDLVQGFSRTLDLLREKGREIAAERGTEQKAA
jgi:hypothetical protein